MSIISTSLTVQGQPSSQFHVEAWLPFRNCEVVYSVMHEQSLLPVEKIVADILI